MQALIDFFLEEEQEQTSMIDIGVNLYMSKAKVEDRVGKLWDIGFSIRNVEHNERTLRTLQVSFKTIAQQIIGLLEEINDTDYSNRILAKVVEYAKITGVRI